IFARNPNKGYSQRGDGSDHAWQWDGQVATEAYVNLPQIVQAAPELAKGILRNYLAVQEPDGFIDWKPGLAGQRNRALCIPLLATIAWTIYEYTEDRDFIAEVYDGLKQFVLTWFKERYDRDQDGLPEWSHTVQSAFDECPSFVRWERWGQAADITLAESPDLASYLYRECRSLINMASLLGKAEDSPPLIARAEMIRIAAYGMWRDDTASYHYVDIETHESPPGYELARSVGRIDNSPYNIVDIETHESPPGYELARSVGRREAGNSPYNIVDIETHESPPGHELARSVGRREAGNSPYNINRRFSPMARVLVRVFGERDAQPPQVAVTIHGRGQRGRHRIEFLPPRRMVWYW
ncbi:MAG: hypothetical protein AAB217_20205, partial [Chloroflexota bacterium]